MRLFTEFFMKITKPDYFDRFRCIAGACPDSCCKEWAVEVDPDSAKMYRSLPGSLGDRLRAVLKEEGDSTIMTIQDGRCPMWRDDGLCRIQAELGHDALCATCRDFPRLKHDYGDFVEMDLELSCPEAARLILSAPPSPPVVAEIAGGTEADYDSQDMQLLLRTREEAYSLMQGRRPEEALALLLLYGYHVQAILDGEADVPFSPESQLAFAGELAKPSDPDGFLAFFRSLEILTEEWKARLDAPTPVPAPMDERYLSIARYFIRRYWLQAVSDLDLVSRVKLAVISCIAVQLLGGDLTATAQLYSKEIENDADNIDAILDGAYRAPAFTDDKLLGFLLL